MNIPDLPQDSGSAFGHQAPTVSAEGSPKQTKYRSFLDHSMGCEDCDYGNVRCPVAREIWAEWQALQR